jgi:hypothetical protein
MNIDDLELHEIVDLCDAGGGMTDTEAERMREIVSGSEWCDTETADIPEKEWMRMLAKATE